MCVCCYMRRKEGRVCVDTACMIRTFVVNTTVYSSKALFLLGRRMYHRFKSPVLPFHAQLKEGFGLKPIGHYNHDTNNMNITTTMMIFSSHFFYVCTLIHDT